MVAVFDKRLILLQHMKYLFIPRSKETTKTFGGLQANPIVHKRAKIFKRRSEDCMDLVQKVLAGKWIEYYPKIPGPRCF